VSLGYLDRCCQHLSQTSIIDHASYDTSQTGKQRYSALGSSPDLAHCHNLVFAWKGQGGIDDATSKGP
jgi:hypothetical protein